MDAEKNPRPSARRSGGRQWKAFLAGVLTLVVVIGGALFGLNRFMSTANHTAESAPATQTAIEGAGPMPQWLAAAPSDVIADYTWAASHHNELQYFPCFCGCNKSAGHVSNSDCYFVRDGKSTIKAYDAHAYG